jgi:aerobic-type carbon monoxide dehydrogenase small subunit (CoxS/CutS family)
MRDAVEIWVNDRKVQVPSGISVAAAVFISGEQKFRASVTGEARAPLCGMGICFECRVTIDGRAHCRSCQILIQPGMRVETA